METAELECFFSGEWADSIQRSRKGLDPDDLDAIKSFRSWADVQHVLKSDSPSVFRIKPALSHLHHFAGFFETKLGPQLDASFFWGTLGCLLQIAAEDSSRLDRIPRMLKSFAHKAETFNGYCTETEVITNPLKESCFDMQIQLVEFFTASIKWIHEADTSKSQKLSPIQLIEERYTRTTNELLEAIERAEKVVRKNEPIRVQSPPSTDTNTTLQNPRVIMLPETRTARLFDRVDVFEQLDKMLGLAAPGTPFKSVALYGLGGVGKSSIASTYMERRFNDNAYDIVLWVRGENPSSLRQSFTDIAVRLELPKAQRHTHDENLILVQDWFQSTGCRWLVVYDNVEAIEMLRPYWPGSSQGHALITTRNPSLAFEPASSGLEVASWDSETGSQFLLFLLRKSIGRDVEAEGNSALALSERLSGHALAISHMAGLIYQSDFSIQEFTTMYLKNPRAAHNELEALWEFSFKSLDSNSRSLLGIMSFLMPDIILQELFEPSPNRPLPEDLSFCSEEFSFSAVLRRLIKLALIKRNRDTRVLSIHRLVQTQFKYFLSTELRQRSFNTAVELVCSIFPQDDNRTRGQLYADWETCNRYLPHVLNLKDCFAEEMKLSKNFKATWQFCELLNLCERYLYEANALSDLETLCKINLTAVGTLEDGPQKSDLRATIISHQANLAESLGNGEKAIELNKSVYEIRLNEEPQNHVLLCFVSSNLGYCCNTANDHESSLAWFQKSQDWWTSSIKNRTDQPDSPGFLLKNTARCLFYLNNLREAKKMVQSSIVQLKDTKPLNWAMLAYAYFVLGTIARREKEPEIAEAHFMEAQNSWLKGDQTRLHPFNGGCLYKMGACCLDQGKVEASIKHIRDSMEVTKFHVDKMPVEHARNLFKLSEALLQDNQDDSNDEAERLRDSAEIFLKRRKPDMVASDTESAYDDLIPIFWR